ncbi:hypothetical protein HanXRQr2_Chr17g0809531 [Helianthus annuus]|uniref:Uncharacterized protein n=1 Tax=Helianthus annuus TaxID=4232 RepID=A0A9K3DJ39_HELAN|nr:hypothetical protein HanXRQr2_Chr17g0809531 [Helianthus annuus]
MLFVLRKGKWNFSYPVQCKIASATIESPSWNSIVPSLKTRLICYKCQISYRYLMKN